MKQPDSLDVGTKMDVVRHRLNVPVFFGSLYVTGGLEKLVNQKK